MPNVRNSTQTKKTKKVAESKEIFTVTDPLQKFTAKKTDLRGRVEPGKNGYFETADASLANEIKARYPWMLVTRHEKQAGRANAFATFRVNGMREGKLDDSEMEKDGWVRDGTRWVKRIGAG